MSYSNGETVLRAVMNDEESFERWEVLTMFKTWNFLRRSKTAVG